MVNDSWPCSPTRPPRKGRAHALVIDGGWREVADTALAFVQRSPRQKGDVHADWGAVDRPGGARSWWLFLVSGIVWLLLAWMVLRLNATSITTVGVLVGVVFLIAGINEVGMAALAPGGWKVWHAIMAGIFALGGLWGFVRPVNTFFALASVLGLILVFYGSLEIIRGWPRGR